LGFPFVLARFSGTAVSRWDILKRRRGAGESAAKDSAQALIRFVCGKSVGLLVHGGYMSRGRRKRSVRDLSRDHATPEEAIDIVKFLQDAPDIAVAILATSQVEMMLEKAIFEKLRRNDQDTINLLTEAGGPLSGMHAKVSLAYAMGIIDETAKRNLNVVRNIRNAFAHAKRRISFDEPEVLDELRDIQIPSRAGKDERAILVDAKGKAFSGRPRFFALCTALFMKLSRRKMKQLSQQIAALDKKIAVHKAAFTDDTLPLEKPK
jgi:DNA-binding MltR family transcriptional regulator